jgi:hypothetical protein
MAQRNSWEVCRKSLWFVACEIEIWFQMLSSPWEVWLIMGLSWEVWLIMGLSYNQVDYATMAAIRCSISAGVARASESSTAISTGLLGILPHTFICNLGMSVCVRRIGGRDKIPDVLREPVPQLRILSGQDMLPGYRFQLVKPGEKIGKTILDDLLVSRCPCKPGNGSCTGGFGQQRNQLLPDFHVPGPCVVHAAVYDVFSSGS